MLNLTNVRDTGMRVAMISLHTSPLEKPGSGDAGGLNVYVAQTAKRLAEAGVKVDVFTRATASAQSDVVPMGDGVQVFNLPAGPYEGLRKEDLPSQVCPFTAELLRVAANRPEGFYDLVHSHYWLSGQAAWLASQRWNVPMVHTMHTMAKVKNESLFGPHGTAEPLTRIVGEEQIVNVADRLVANTADERSDLMRLYNAAADKVSVVHPGVDLGTFRPGSRAASRQKLGLSADKIIVLFVGRIQPLKAPDLLVRAVANFVQTSTVDRNNLQVVIVGGLSGNGMSHPDSLEKLAASLGVLDLVKFVAPVSSETLADYYRSADFTVVPSYSESFGLVALESQASGTPVLATSVGGLRTAVCDGHSGLLVPNHDVATWSRAVGQMVQSPQLRQRLAAGAVDHAAKFSWSAAAEGTLDVYSDALAKYRVRDLEPIF